MFIMAASFFGFMGTGLGVLWLGVISGIEISLPFRLVSVHPDLQVFGFLVMFIMGASYSIIPRFKNRRLDNRLGAYVSFILMTGGNAVSLVHMVMPSWYLPGG